MLTDVHGKEGDSLAELFVRRSDDGVLANHTISSRPDIGQVAANDGAALYDHLAVQNNVLGTTEHRVATNFVTRSL